MQGTEGVGGTTRGGVLKRLALLAGGAAGLGAVGGKMLGEQAAIPAAVPAAADRKTKTVVLHGRNWRHAVHDAEHGKRARDGGQLDHNTSDQRVRMRVPRVWADYRPAKMIAQSFQGIDVKGFNDAVHKNGANGRTGRLRPFAS